MSTLGIEIKDRILIRYTGNETDVIIDDDILSIADNAFSGNQSIEKISIQSQSLRAIGKRSFYNCENLNAVQVKALRGGIGESAFEGCTKLTSFIIPHGMMEIGPRAFHQCSPHFLVFIPASVYVIGEQAVDKDCVIVGNTDSYAEQYAKKEDVAFRIDLGKTIKDLHKRALIEKNGNEKSFVIFGETITASSTLRIYQSVLEYYQNEKERLSDMALKGLPTKIPMSSGQSNAFINVLNTANNGTKTLISRVEQYGVILPESTTFLDVLLPLTKLVKCGSLISEAVTEGANATNETIESAKRSLINEAESKVTGLSYGILGGPLDMVLYGIDDFRERQRQRAAAYAEADAKLQQYITQTQNSTNQQFASFMKETAIPTFLSSIEEYYDALRDAELNVLKQNNILVGRIPALDDITKSSQIVKSASSDPNSDNEYAIALSLKQCPFNKSSFMMATRTGIASDSLLALASYVGFGDEAGYIDIDKYSLLEKYVAGGKISVDGFADYCANTTLFGETLSKNAFIFIRDEVLKFLSCIILPKLSMKYDGHNQDEIVAKSKIIAEENVCAETREKLSSSNIDVSSSAVRVANAYIKDQQSTLYNETQGFIESNGSLSASIICVKEREPILGDQNALKLLQTAVSRCEEELSGIIRKYSSSETAPTYETLVNDVHQYITEQDLAFLNDKGIQVFKQTFTSHKELCTYIADRISVTKETNAKNEEQYIRACSLQEKAQCSEEYEKAAKIFERLSLYKDSMVRKDACIRKQEQLAKEEKYAEAAATLKKAKSKSDYEEAAAKFNALADYKDSNEKVNAIYKTRQRKHNISVALSVLAGIIILSGAIAWYFLVLQPKRLAQHYSLANEALASGNYVEAIKEFKAANGFEDSDTFIETIKTEHPDAYRASLDVGQSFTFGTYNGEPIDWVILDKQGTQTLIISRNILCERPFNRSDPYQSPPKAPWKNSQLRSWLNADFYNEAFSEEEASRILTTTINTPDSNINYVVEGGGDTTDKVFLLSTTEASKYMSLIPDVDGVWWLRNPGSHNGYSAVVRGKQVNSSGISNNCGGGGTTATREDWENNTIYGPRPVMWVNLDY